MAVIDQYELTDRRQASAFPNGRGGVTRTYNRVITVVTDDNKDGPYIAGSASEIPEIGDAYAAGNDSDPNAVCVKIDPQIRSGEARIWDVAIEYTTDPPTGSIVENPLDSPVEKSLSFAQFQKPAEKDLADKAVVNSAKSPFDPPVEIDDSRPILVIVKNFDMTIEAAGAIAVLYQDATNTDTFFGFPPYTFKANITVTEQTFGVITYCRMAFEFHGRRELWYPTKILDRGYSKLETEGGIKVRKQILDFAGQPLAEPSLLNGSGVPIALTSGGDLATAAQYIEFDFFKRLPYSALGLETEIIE